MSCTVRADDITVDGEGRVAIANGHVPHGLRTVGAKPRKPPPPKPNTNCEYCNTAKGCDGENINCHPNTVPNCGCKRLA